MTGDLPKFKSWLARIVALGAVVRLCAFTWNTRLFGDVNLYALVARQWRESGSLDYPAKFDFFASAPYLALNTPVSQHPPAWSWLAGLIASAGLGLDEFAALKLLCLFFGLALIILGMSIARTLAGNRAAVGTGLVLALHPMLVDYSANGSPYIAVAACVLAVIHALLVSECSVWLRGALAGTAAALACNFHGVGLLLIPSGFMGLALIAAPATRLRMLSGFTLASALLVIPLFAWNTAHFGSLLHSTSTFYLQGKLGLVHMVEDSTGIHYQVGELGWRHLGPYARLAFKSSLQFILHLGLETGFTSLLLAGFGCLTLKKNLSRNQLAAAALVVLTLIAPCLGWPEFKYRFLVLALPLVVILAVLGFEANRSSLRRPFAVFALAGCTVFWVVQMALTGSPAKYYAYDLKHRDDYRLMKEAATFLGKQPHGVVLSFPSPLDGGVEAVWWHHQPAVLARGFTKSRLQRLNVDFQPAYLLLSPDRRDQVETIAPDATLCFENNGYLVYRRTPGNTDAR
jgi:4-amino-4-deoxy-L-arabinose transferase-like glycosyltransferase